MLRHRRGRGGPRADLHVVDAAAYGGLLDLVQVQARAGHQHQRLGRRGSVAVRVVDAEALHAAQRLARLLRLRDAVVGGLLVLLVHHDVALRHEDVAVLAPAIPVHGAARGEALGGTDASTQRLTSYIYDIYIYREIRPAFRGVFRLIEVGMVRMQDRSDS